MSIELDRRQLTHTGLWLECYAAHLKAAEENAGSSMADAMYVAHFAEKLRMVHEVMTKKLGRNRTV